MARAHLSSQALVGTSVKEALGPRLSWQYACPSCKRPWAQSSAWQKPVTSSTQEVEGRIRGSESAWA